jgi:hypothetical protein
VRARKQASTGLDRTYATEVPQRLRSLTRVSSWASRGCPGMCRPAHSIPPQQAQPLPPVIGTVKISCAGSHHMIR